LIEDPEEHNKQTIIEKIDPIKPEDMQEFNVFKFNDENLEKRLEQLEKKQDNEKMNPKKKEVV
tara:strand:+ start:293 stop:481 length:189 start_codon:yes stop_codon:yes gene_type:complete